MLFDKDECSIIASALETYEESKRSPLKPEVLHRLVKSSLQKLDSITVLTSFTKQEYTVMALAVNHIIKCYDLLDSDADNNLYTLLDKLMELA